MGIIKQIKKMFSKNIDCSELLENTVFHNYTSKNRTFTVGANILVPTGFSAVFVCKDKPTDVLPDGKFAISGVNLPKTFEKLKLAKANKKGNYPKKFNADLYFIKTHVCAGLQFNSFTQFIKKSKRYGTIKGYSEGTFDLLVYDPKKLLSYLLKEYPLITNKLYLELVGGVVGDAVNEALSNFNKGFLEIITSPNEVYNYLNSEPESNFEFAGFKISNIKLSSINVKEKLRKQIEEDLKNQKSFSVDIQQKFDVDINQDELKVTKTFNEENEETYTPMSDIGYTTCKVCGHKINRSAKFCENCGASQL